MKKFILTILTLFIIGAVAWLLLYDAPEDDNNITSVNSFRECADAGYAIMESYPRQCSTPDGETFTEDIGNELEKTDLIRINEPRPNESVQSPLTITGEARGYWFFEASFSVRIYDANGNELGVGIAEAQEDWMTEEFVPFELTLEFEPFETKTGTLVLEKDNPSGLPENDDELRVPVEFSQVKTSRASDGCVITGCSSQVCADEEVATTCEFREEYACYATAVCEKQEDGQCGWTETEELKQCLGTKQEI